MKCFFERKEYDDNFSEEEVKLIDDLIKTSLEKKKIISEEELKDLKLIK